MVILIDILPDVSMMDNGSLHIYDLGCNSSVVSYAGQGNFLDRRSLVFCYIRRREQSGSYFLVYVVRIDGSFTMPTLRPLTLASRSLT